MISGENREFIETEWSGFGDDSHYVAVLTTQFQYAGRVHDHIETMCTRNYISPQDTIQILLISDELISNALLASLERRDRVESYVIVHLFFNEKYVRIIVFDSAGGMDLKDISRKLPKGKDKKEYLESLEIYRETTAINFTSEGKQIEHKRLGKGLKIIQSLADIFEFYYHDNESNLTANVTENTVGTIIAIQYNYKNLPAPL